METARFCISIPDNLKKQLDIIRKKKSIKIATLIKIYLKKHISLIEKQNKKQKKECKK